MVSYLVRKLIRLVTVLLAVSTVTFAIVHLTGDPSDGFVDPAASPEVRASIRSHLGLDESLPQQYRTFLSNAVRGDLGTSWRADQPASTLVLNRLENTLLLAATALALALLTGTVIGIAHARTSSPVVRSVLDWIITIGQSLPAFWVGSMLVIVFAVNLSWLPSSGNDGWQSLILPSVTLALMPAMLIARLTSTQLHDALRTDYVRTARGKGLAERTVFVGHALRESYGPLLGYISVQIGFLIGGAVIVEGVFAYPGIGTLALNAVRDRDLPVIQAFVIVVATLIVLTTNIIDLIALWLDPRIRPGAVS